MSLLPPDELCPHGHKLYRLPDGSPMTFCTDCGHKTAGALDPDAVCVHGQPLIKLFGASEPRSPVCDQCAEEAKQERDSRRIRRETFYPSATEQKAIDVELPPPKPRKKNRVTDDNLFDAPLFEGGTIKDEPVTPPTTHLLDKVLQEYKQEERATRDTELTPPDVLVGVVEQSGLAPVLKLPRVSWDEYFMSIAVQVATRATCDRKHVGAVIVRNRTILSTGYNGSPRGLPHCDDVGHEMKDMGGRQSCIRTVHAEANAITQAARTGTAIEGAELYTTASPCYDCLKMIVNSGIKKVVCLEFYDSRYGVSGDMERLAKEAGVEMIFLKKED